MDETCRSSCVLTMWGAKTWYYFVFGVLQRADVNRLTPSPDVASVNPHRERIIRASLAICDRVSTAVQHAPMRKNTQGQLVSWNGPPQECPQRVAVEVVRQCSKVSWLLAVDALRFVESQKYTHYQGALLFQVLADAAVRWAPQQHECKHHWPLAIVRMLASGPGPYSTDTVQRFWTTWLAVATEEQIAEADRVISASRHREMLRRPPY